MGSQLQPGRHVVSYDSLKTWIYEQEEYERRTGLPAPLTPEQLNAMAVLVLPLPPPSPPSAPSPSASTLLQVGVGTDYISLLMRK